MAQTLWKFDSLEVKLKVKTKYNPGIYPTDLKT